ncbi:MAG: hypothetical protein OXU25_01085, partial [Thaumarchaeota archaeon]|nr:hypothetical protein [Nitrososphaerota archaeon]
SARPAMAPGIGLMKRRLEKESDAVSLAVSHIAKGEGAEPASIRVLETKYHADSGDWYVALGWADRRAVVRMDSVLARVIESKEV